MSSVAERKPLELSHGRVNAWLARAAALLQTETFAVIALVVFGAWYWTEITRYLELKTAYGAWSPLHYVHAWADPNAFARDFRGGLFVWDQSAFMHLYKLAFLVGVQPETMLPLVVGVEIALLSAGSWALSVSLFPKASALSRVALIVLVIASNGRNVDLNRFQQPFFMGLFYNVADALRLFGLAAAFRGRAVAAAVLLALTFITHPLKAIAAGVFLAVAFADYWRALFTRAGAVVVAVAGTICGSWFLYTYNPTALGMGRIPESLWYPLTELTNHHWYPFRTGVFTHEYAWRILPCLSLGGIFLLSRRLGGESYSRVARGLIAILMLVAVGVALSTTKAHPTLVKLNLHRACELYVFIALLYAVHWLWEATQDRSAIKAMLATTVLLSPLFVVVAPFPIALVALLVALELGREEKGRLALFGWLALFSVVVTAYTVAGRIATVRELAAYLGSAPVWKVALPFLGVSFFVGRYRWGEGLRRVALLGTVMALSTIWARAQAPSADFQERASAHLEGQRWAEQATPTGAVFMTDPSQSFLWRNYSKRCSFGSVFEWVVFWLYNSDYGSYEEGMRRFAKLGLPIERYFVPKPSLDGYFRLLSDAREKFYSLSDAERLELARADGVDYFVLEKDRMTHSTALPVAFENVRLIVLDAREGRT